MADRFPISTHLVLLRMLKTLSEKAKSETQCIQQLKAMADRIPVSKHLVLLWMLQILSEKAKSETQFIQQLKGHGRQISYKYTFGSVTDVKNPLREGQVRNPVHTAVERQ